MVQYMPIIVVVWYNPSIDINCIICNIWLVSRDIAVNNVSDAESKKHTYKEIFILLYFFRYTYIAWHVDLSN